MGISYNAAWRSKQKFMQVMMERGQGYKPSGFIALDEPISVVSVLDASRGAEPRIKPPLWLMLKQPRSDAPSRIKLTIIKDFKSSEISNWSKKYLCSGSTVISDGPPCFNAITEADCVHDKIVCGGGLASAEEPEFYFVSTVLGNSKSVLRSTYHSIKSKYAQHYLAEFQYRFTRRFDLSALIPRLIYLSLRTPPLPER
nr:IS1595 family transposase [Microbulbifer sp. GL-2]